jgi:8-oxo-dGTP diphosphatase
VTKVVHVAAGVVLNAQHDVLLALRPLDKHQGGLWEFPGGKVEPNETVAAALARELYEELNLTVTTAEPFLIQEHDYGDKLVKLDVWLVREFSGEPHGREGQTLRWVPLTELGSYQFPAANNVIVKTLLSTTFLTTI